MRIDAVTQVVHQSSEYNVIHVSFGDLVPLLMHKIAAFFEVLHSELAQVANSQGVAEPVVDSARENIENGA